MPSPSAGEGEWPSGAQTQTNADQPITGETHGVVGISNLKLSAANEAEGSIVSSEKSNMKLQSAVFEFCRALR